MPAPPVSPPRNADPAGSSPSPAVRAAQRRVEHARATGRLAPPVRARPAAPPAGALAEAPATGTRRGPHVVDRALAYRRLADGGMAAVAIARRVRKSRAHVSILLRLGAALDGMEPGELAALRTPAVTWRLVQRLVRGDTRVQSPGEHTAAVVALRRALRDAVAGFSSHTVDRRRHRKGRTPGAPALERFDPGAFAADPAGYVASHAERLAAAHEALARQALRMLDQALVAERLAAVPLSTLARLSRPQLAAIAARGREHLTPAQQQAVDALEATSRLLAQLHEIAARARTGGAAARPPAPAFPSDPAAAVTAEDIDADLGD